MAVNTTDNTKEQSADTKAVEALIQYIWNIESHHWTCPQCHAMSEIEETLNLRIPEHPHLCKLRRRRKELLRRLIVEEGERVGGIRAENELLVEVLRQVGEGSEMEEEGNGSF